MSKFILVTSGVCSTLGKGVASASIGSLLECSGLKVSMVKCDPYINLDAGNISPFQHGEIYVTEDGSETDLDLGNFSRYTNSSITSANSITIGKIYNQVIQNERARKYNGKTVQVIPHITDEIKQSIFEVGARSEADVVIVEIGGTVGDIESIPFLEASRQLIHELGKNQICTIHLTLVPEITGGELKTKPTQHSVKQLQKAGIQPDMLLCRTTNQMGKGLREKLALFCNVSPNGVFTTPDVQKSVYELPVIFHKQGVDDFICKKLALTPERCNIRPWTSFLDKLNSDGPRVCIALVGKKDYLDDCSKSVRESLFHAAVTSFGAKLETKKIDAEMLETLHSEKEIASIFKDVNGIIIPENYGHRGFLGLLITVKYAREKHIPFFGIDLGMQLMAIETSRTLCKWEDADSTEFIQNCEHPIISLPEEQAGLSVAGMMKLGAAPVKIVKGTKLASIYKKSSIMERHRNKYTFNNKYKADMEEHGLIVSAFSELDGRTEAFEWQNHPWGIGVQYHPEFVSKPTKPHPLFVSFIEAALKQNS
ncbi:MAG: CTP synthase [Treponema sp.]|nr:CTP synthase [Treponema sp.]